MAESIGPLDPNLLTPQAVSKRLEHTNLVVDPVDALGPVRSRFSENILPVGTNYVVERYLIAGNKLLAAIAVGLKPGQGIDDRLMGYVVRAKRQGIEQQGQHPAVMMTVGAAKHRVDMTLIR